MFRQEGPKSMSFCVLCKGSIPKTARTMVEGVRLLN